jgi:hypothetical protein
MMESRFEAIWQIRWTRSSPRLSKLSGVSIFAVLLGADRVDVKYGFQT